MFKNDQGHLNSHKNWERSYRINLDNNTKRYLHGYMQQELKYYNSLVTGFNSKIRVLCKEIDGIKDQMERIWLAVAQTSCDLRTLIVKDASEWPEPLRLYRDTITDGKKLLINDRTMMLIDIAASKAILHLLVRRSIAAEVLRWVQPQAKQIADADESSTGQMRSPLQMLQPFDNLHKRHLQLSKDLTDISYDQQNRSTVIKIPYSSISITVEGHDLTKQPHDHIIIRQKPGMIPDENTPWLVTVKEGSGRYLLDLVEMTNTSTKRIKRRAA